MNVSLLTPPASVLYVSVASNASASCLFVQPASARYGLAGAGTQNAGIAFGGDNGISSVSCTEEYNGSSWSAGGALINQRRALAGAGTQTSALAFGGDNGISSVSCTEEYNGTSWSAGGALINQLHGKTGIGFIMPRFIILHFPSSNGTTFCADHDL